jgi:hypothetical protein
LYAHRCFYLLFLFSGMCKEYIVDNKDRYAMLNRIPYKNLISKYKSDL